MRVLLDTHVWLWMHAEPERLSKRAIHLIEASENDLLLSSASTWEIAIKHGLGRIDLGSTPARALPEMMQQTGLTGLPIMHEHSIRAGMLPRHHADPFDRMLIAQAQVENVAIVTADRIFGRYDVKVISAGKR